MTAIINLACFLISQLPWLSGLKPMLMVLNAMVVSVAISANNAVPGLISCTVGCY